MAQQRRMEAETAADPDEGLTWFEHGILDRTLYRMSRVVPAYLDDAEGAEWLRGYDNVEDVTNG